YLLQGAEYRTVEKPPHQGADDGGHCVRKEDHEPREPGEPSGEVVEHEGGRKGDGHLDGYEDQGETDNEPYALEELRIQESMEIVLQATEPGTRREPLGEQAEVQGVGEGSQE